jgi:hypothetical protein
LPASGHEKWFKKKTSDNHTETNKTNPDLKVITEEQVKRKHEDDSDSRPMCENLTLRF